MLNAASHSVQRFALFVVCTGVALAILSGQRVSSADPDESQQELFALFDEVAYRRKGRTADNSERIEKWIWPVNAIVLGNVNKATRQHLTSEIDRVKAIGAIDISLDADFGFPNLVFVFSNNMIRATKTHEQLFWEFVLQSDDNLEGIRSHFRKSIRTCVPLVRGNRGPNGVTGILDLAIVVVNTRLDPDEQNKCISKYLAVALGFNGRSEHKNSVVNSDPTVDRLTDLDLQVLQLIYDPKVEPGESRETANIVVREIVENGQR